MNKNTPGNCPQYFISTTGTIRMILSSIIKGYSTERRRMTFIDKTRQWSFFHFITKMNE